MQKRFYSLASFLAGFSLMTVELVSSRIAAPSIGSSVYTWTAVIGVTLLGLALGTYIGGVLADKYSTPKLLPYSFLLSAVFVFLVVPLSFVTGWVQNLQSLIVMALAFALQLFLLPAVSIGLIQPIIVKRYVQDVTTLGKNYGWLSTLWSVGSILGVFVTGFYFVSYLGSRETLFLVSLILTLMSLVSSLIYREKKIAIIALVLLVVFIFTNIFLHKENAKIIYKKETAYYDAKVVDFNFYPYGPSRALTLDLDTHSVQTDGPVKNTTYEESHPLFKPLNKNINDILVIGAGAYTLPVNFKNYYPEAEVSVMEIDPEIPTIAEKYFGLDTKKMKTIIGDARVLLNKDPKTYDIIFGDAYNSFISVPSHLLTKEFNELVKTRLNPDGIYALNFISSLEGKNALMFKSIYATFLQTFPSAYVLHLGNDSTSVQNVILVGVNGKKPVSEQFLREEMRKIKRPVLSGALVLDPSLYIDTKVPILTDNFFPTERLMASSIEDYYHNYQNFVTMLFK